MTLERRIEALERRCKRLGKTLVGVGTLALFAVVAGTAGWTVAYTGHISPKSITTETIVLKDKAGKTRLRLSGLGGSVKAYDKAGNTRVYINSKYGSVKVNDSAGKQRAELFAGHHLTGGGLVVAYDKTGSERALLKGSTGTVYVYDSAGKTRLQLRGTDGTIYAYDSGEKWRVKLDGETGKISFKTLNTRGTISHP